MSQRSSSRDSKSTGSASTFSKPASATSAVPSGFSSGQNYSVLGADLTPVSVAVDELDMFYTGFQSYFFISRWQKTPTMTFNVHM